LIYSQVSAEVVLLNWALPLPYTSLITRERVGDHREVKYEKKDETDKKK
jgi:hypothetical protein